MAIKKVKNQLKDKIATTITDVISEFNSNIGDKLKKSALNSAKKISEKFAKTLKEFEKAEKKSAKKKSKKLKKVTKAKTKAIERAKNNVTAVKKATSSPVRTVATKAAPGIVKTVNKRTPNKSTATIATTAPRKRRPAAPKVNPPDPSLNGNNPSEEIQ